MQEHEQPYCPECDDFQETDGPDRRAFLRVAGLGTASLLGLGAVRGLRAEEKGKAAERASKPAEELVRELYATMSDDQKKEVVLPYDHGGKSPTRLRMYNRPIGDKAIGRVYTRPQQELVERILKAMCADDEGYRRLSRGGKFDAGSMLNCGAHIFGDPATRSRTPGCSPAIT